MKIIVLIKQVPDTYGDRILTADGTIDRKNSEPVIDEINEKAVEMGLRLQENNGAEVTVLTMGPAKALDSLRKALAMGADNGIHIVDDALHGSDALQTSAVIAAAIRTVEFDLVIAGSESTDGGTGAIPAMLAERLGVPQLTFLSSLEVTESTVSGNRSIEDGYVEITATLPAVVSVTEKIAEARFPNFKGIMRAKKKPMTVLTAADLGFGSDSTGGSNSWSLVRDSTPRPARQAGTVITDDGTAGAQLADFLATSKLI